jgi:adenylate cyclase
MAARDEATALMAVRIFEDIVRAQVAAAGGRVVKFLGDGSLAEFNSTRAAVGCALAIQAAVAARTGESGVAERLRLRIGIHSGDLVERDADVFGDAVNVAARIHPVADPGGIALSGAV